MKRSGNRTVFIPLAIFAAIVALFAIYAFRTETSNRNIVINEICPENLSCLYDENGKHPDWVELYNKSDREQDISGWFLSDSAEKRNRWEFPAGTVIPSHGYLTVFMDGSKPEEPDMDENFSLSDFVMTGEAIPRKNTGLHASFRLSESETLYLSAKNHNNVDMIDPVPVQYDTTYGRKEDGSGIYSRMTPTPGSSNNESKEAVYPTLSKPVFSKESGFFDSDFDLEISSTEGEIYYTLDGSNPTSLSARYEGPIHICDRSDEENMYASIKECSVALLPYVKRFRGSKAPTEPVLKCTVVRAVVIDKAGNISETETRSFFPGSSDDYFKDIGVISLVTDPDNLFDYEKGIYVIGKNGVDDFMEHLSASENALKYIAENPDTPTDGSVMIENVQMDEFTNCNYRQRGSAWEREADITIFNDEHELDSSQNCGIRIRGNRTCNFPKKSLNLYARSMYGDKLFKTSFFNTDYSRLSLFSGGQDELTISKDLLIKDLTEDLNFFSLDFTRPYALFIDGEFWGIYRISEKLDGTTISHRYGVDADEVIIVKSDLLSKGIPSDDELLGEFKHFIQIADFSRGTDYERFQEMADIDSIIDYYSARFYTDKGMDWPNVNTGFWRTRNVKKNNPYADGRWRCVNFDNNSNLDYENISSNTIKKTVQGTKTYGPDILFTKLIKNEDFKNRFLSRFRYIALETFEPSKSISLLNKYASEIRPYMEMEFNRYYEGYYTITSFDKDIEDIRKYFRERADYIIPMAEEICR